MTVSLGSGQVAVLDMRMVSATHTKPVYYYCDAMYCANIIFRLTAKSSVTVASARWRLLRLPAGQRRQHMRFLVQRLYYQVREDLAAFFSACSTSSFKIIYSVWVLCRTWDVATAQGVCESPTSITRFPDFPVLTAAWDLEHNALYCGGGGGSPGGAPATGKGGRGFSFIGTPIHQIHI